MEFKRERAYSSVNAEELQIGDKVIVEDTIHRLKASLDYPAENIADLEAIRGDDARSRFIVGGCSWALAYLVERKECCKNCGNKECRVSYGAYVDTLYKCGKYMPGKAEKHYRPFRDTDELIDYWVRKTKEPLVDCEMPNIWVRRKDNQPEKGRLLIGFIGTKTVELAGHYGAISMESLFENYEFIDGSFCGVEGCTNQE